MEDLFNKIFERSPTQKEKIVLHRLSRIYGDAILFSAIKLSAVVITGSPINYISAVCRNLESSGDYSDAVNTANKNLAVLTQQRIEEIKKYKKA